ncbi:MAG: hypothetical protein LKI80_11215 [Sporolactobacillus sp.]|nr:hypothetical protein [Sporolactobacillus sp.]
MQIYIQEELRTFLVKGRQSFLYIVNLDRLCLTSVIPDELPQFLHTA